MFTPLSFWTLVLIWLSTPVWYCELSVALAAAVELWPTIWPAYSLSVMVRGDEKLPVAAKTGAELAMLLASAAEIAGLNVPEVPSSKLGLATRLGLTSMVAALSTPPAGLRFENRWEASPGAAPLRPLSVVGNGLLGGP